LSGAPTPPSAREEQLDLHLDTFAGAAPARSRHVDGPRAWSIASSSGNIASSTPAHTGGSTMIVMFSARRLKPGAWDQFRRAWDPGDTKPPGFQRAYHARNIRDEDEIISFGLFDMSEDDYRRWRAEADAEEIQRVD